MHRQFMLKSVSANHSPKSRLLKSMDDFTSMAESTAALDKAVQQEKPIEKISLNFEPQQDLIYSDRGDNAARVCRICLDEEETIDNPIVNPCNCSGTMKNVHLNCFKDWISKQVTQKKSSSVVSIAWKNLYCELCKTDCDRNYS